MAITPPRNVTQTLGDREIVWEVGRELGKGHFATAFEFKNLETGRLWAGKVISKASLQQHKPRVKRLEEELDIHQSLSADGEGHPNVLYMDSYFQDENYYYLILEMCPHETLMELLRERKTLTEWEVRFYIAQLAAGIGYCHERNILHRDLKLGNIFLGNGLKVKIADFGYAKRLSKSTERRTSICGTPNYIAPEILQSQNKKQPGPGHSFEVDIWTIGIVMYTLLCGKPPFEATDGTVKTTYDNIRRNTLTFDKGPTHPHQKHTPHHPPSAAAQDLITQMLHPEPSQRITVAAILAHPFLSMKLPSQLPISALRVPPSRKGKSHQGYDGVEPRLLFVCLERTLSTSEQTADPADFTPASQPEPEPSPERHEEAAARAAGAPATRWRCCVVSGAPPPKPPALMPAAVSRSDVVGSAVADGTVHQFQPGEVVSVVEFGPETEVGGVSMPSRLRTEHGWVEMVRDRRALFVEVPSVRPQPSMDLATICMAVGRSISAIETLLDDEVEDLRAQRDEALALAADRLEQLNSRVPQPQPTSDSGSGDSSREEEPEPEPEQREEGVPEEGVPPASAGSAVIGEVQRGSVAHTPPLPLPRLVSVAAPASAPPAQLVMRESVAGVSRTRVALPNRPAPRPPTQPQSATALITEDILSQPWADARDMLLDSGVWAEPSDAYTNPELVVGKRVWIDGQGPGVVREFVAKTIGSNAHAVSFYALPQFLAISTEGELADVVNQYSVCPRLTIRRVKTLHAGGLWLVEK